MKTPKEYLFEKHPEVIEKWGLTNHDDEYMCRMMEEYAEYRSTKKMKLEVDVVLNVKANNETN